MMMYAVIEYEMGSQTDAVMNLFPALGLGTCGYQTFKYQADEIPGWSLFMSAPL